MRLLPCAQPADRFEPLPVQLHHAFVRGCTLGRSVRPCGQPLADRSRCTKWGLGRQADGHGESPQGRQRARATSPVLIRPALHLW